MDTSLFKNLLIGRTLCVKMAGGDIEYQRKATLLIILNYLIMTMQGAFICLSLARGEYIHVAINAAVLFLVLLGYFLLRLRGNLIEGTYIIITLLSIQFLWYFHSDTNYAMWSFTIPVVSFFIVGIRGGATVVAIYWTLTVLSFSFTNTKNYSIDFKIRFEAIFFCLTFSAYFLERVRQQTQKMLQKSHRHSRIQRDIALALGGEGINSALDRVLDIVLQIETIDSGGVYFVDKNSGDLHLIAHRGLSGDFIKNTRFFPADSPNGRIVNTGLPLYTQHINLGVPLSDSIKGEGLKAIAILPVRAEGRILAVLNLASHTHDEIPADIRNLLESITMNIGTAISRLTAIRELHELSSRNDAILAAVPDIIMQVDSNKVYTWANKAGISFFGDDVLGKSADYYFAGNQDTYKTVEPLFKGNDEVIYIESWQRRKDGEKRLLAWWCRTLKNEFGEAIGALSSARDITDSRNLEEQFRQTQKMEAIGHLAGGVAHDFNNQLSIISGFAELIREKVAENTQVCHFADNILLAAKRSADLTGQLLAFSRKGKFLSTAVDLHKIISEVVNILQHTVDKRITIQQTLYAGSAIVMGDPSQIQNALLNIAINARDAMPDGGNLSFSTERINIENNYLDLKHYVLAPGTYIRTSITDTGLGMDAETRSHLFEPFFTTKEKGKGTGMGLPAVYGIVKNHKGGINIYSEPGHGTTVKIYLPASELPVSEYREGDPPPTAAGRKLNIMFVDDEDVLREMAREMLQGLGHSVQVCDNGQSAVERYKESWDSTDLVILDMIMPVMGGKATFAALRHINPRAKVIISSGYSINEEAQSVIDQGALGFVQKPFTTAQLAAAIREAMGEI